MRPFHIIVTLCAASAAFAFLSCAKIETEDMLPLEQKSFDEWVLKHVNGNIPNSVAVRQPNGSYIEFLADGDQTVESSADKELWLMLDYTSRNHEGNVFATRSEAEALRQRSFTPYTYYTPTYAYCSNSGIGIPAGQHYILKNMLRKADGSEIKLTQGTAVRLYMPSYMAFGSDGYQDNFGYGGQYALGGSQIVVDSIAVKEVVEDPVAREERLVAAHAATWGRAAKDSLVWSLYVDSVNFQKPALTGEFPNKDFQKGYALTVDSLANIRYVGRFLPTAEYPEGFIFDTNIESVYDEFYNRRSSERYFAAENEPSVLNYIPSSQQDRFISAFYNFIPKARRGIWYRMVFSSKYGYDSEGVNADYTTTSYGESRVTTEILPYTPLIFEIYIETE